MRWNLSPVLCKQLANLDKDAACRKSAMKAMESYVKEMDSKSIPLFLSQLSEVRETGSLSEEYMISLYEVLARAHGVDIVPHVDSIMKDVVRTLASSGGSLSLQQSCSKVIPAIARYCIDPIMPNDRKRHIIHSLCDPLCQSLLGPQESLSAGAALCLKALVDSDNWQFASDAIVNKVSLNIAVALEVKSNQTNPHIGLVVSLTEKNSLIVEAYARLLIGSGLRILNAGAEECNSQKRLSAIQMVNFLMKSLDRRSIYSELDLIIEEMEKYESDQMAFVKGAAFEALQTARSIIAEKEWKSEMDSTLTFKSNDVGQDNTPGRNFLGFRNQSPESHTLASFSRSVSALKLSNSADQVYSDLNSDNRIVQQRVQRFENGVVDVSLKDGFFSELSPQHDRYPKSEHSRSQVMDNNAENNSDEFTGFVQGSPSSEAYSQSLTPTPRGQEIFADGEKSSQEFVQETPSNGADTQCLGPSPQVQKSPSKFYIGNKQMSSTSSTLVHSLQNTSGRNSGLSIEKQNGLLTSLPSSKSCWSQTGSNDCNGFRPCTNRELGEKETGNMYLGIEHIQVGPESVLLTDAAAGADGGLMHQLVILEDKEVKQRPDIKRSFVMICSISFLLLALITSLMWMDNNQEFSHALPT